MAVPLEELALPRRLNLLLRRAQIDTIEELIECTRLGGTAEIYNLGSKSLKQISDALEKFTGGHDEKQKYRSEAS